MGASTRCFVLACLTITLVACGATAGPTPTASTPVAAPSSPGPTPTGQPASDATPPAQGKGPANGDSSGEQGLSLPTVSLTPGPNSAEIQLGDQITRPQGQCPNLDSVLEELATASDPAGFAASHSLRLAENGVGVEIRLATAGVDLGPYRATVRNDGGLVLEAYVPVAQLCDLAHDPAVLRVSPLKEVLTP